MAAGEWSEKTKMIVTASVGIVANVGLAFWLYSTSEQWKELDAKYQTKKKEIARLKAIRDTELPEAERALKALQLESQAKETKLPEAEEVEKLIDNMAPIAERNFCKKKSQVRSGDAADVNYTRSTWRTTWEADFFGWCKLMNEMEERFPRFVSFENLSITPKNSGVEATGARHDINVDLVTYRYIRH